MFLNGNRFIFCRLRRIYRARHSENHTLKAQTVYYGVGMAQRSYKARFVLLAALMAGVLCVAAHAGEADAIPPGAVPQQPTALIELDGTGSEDPDGEQLEYEWVQLDGPKVELSDPHVAKPYFRTGKPGLYRFQLVVANSQFRSDPFIVEIMIERENHAPVAKAPEEIRGEVRKPIEVDGKESFDPDGDNLTYRWRYLGNRPLRLPDEVLNRPILSFVPDEDGVFEFELTVSDGKEISPPAVTRLVIRPPKRPPIAVGKAIAKEIPLSNAPIQAMTPPAPGDIPVAIIEGPRFARPGEPLVLDGRSSKSSKGMPSKYYWRQKSGPFIRDFELLYSGSVERFSAPREGEYEFELVVSDGTQESQPVVHKLIVEKQTEPPVAVIIAPKQVAIGSLVKLDGTQSYNRHNSPLIYKWRQTGGPRVTKYLIDDKIKDAAPAFHPAEPGLYSFELTVSDGREDSKPVEATINVGEANQPPTIVIQAPGTLRPGERLNMFSRVSDPEGDPVVVTWRQADGPPLMPTYAKQPSLALTLQTPGRYVFEASAFDGINPPVTTQHVVEVGIPQQPAEPKNMAPLMPLPGPAPAPAPVYQAPPPTVEMSPPVMEPQRPQAPASRRTVTIAPREPSARAAAQIHPSTLNRPGPSKPDDIQDIAPLPGLPGFP